MPPPPRAPPPLPPPPFPAARLSCSIIRELVKNGRNDGFGVEPIDMLSMSGPESSPSQHESDSSSWKSASKSRSPRNAAVPLCVSSSSSSLALKRFSSANIFCLKLRCCSEIVWKMQWKEKKKRGKRLKLAQRNQLEITAVKRGGVGGRGIINDNDVQHIHMYKLKLNWKCSSINIYL